MRARELGGETELWRAYRRYAGVLHFVYLTSSDPGGFTSDNFIDIQHLTLEPHFAEAMRQAFNPLGVYLNFWHSSASVNDAATYTIYMVNDEDRPRAGTLRLAFSDVNGARAAAQERPFSLPPLGAQSYSIELKSPVSAGSYVLQAIAEPADDATHPSISSRDVTLQLPPPGK